MTAVQTLGPGSDPMEPLAPVARRVGRASQRGGGRFAAQMAVAADRHVPSEAEGQSWPGRMQGAAGAATDAQVVAAGPEPLPLAVPDQQVQDPVAGPPTVEAEETGEPRGRVDVADRGGPAPVSAPAGRTPVTDGRMTASLDERLPAAPAPDTVRPETLAAGSGAKTPLGTLRPGEEGEVRQGGAAALQTGGTLSAEPTSLPTMRQTRREGAAVVEPGLQAFRLEPANPLPSVAGPTRPAASTMESQQPADILVDTGRMPDARLDVTIAAATPDLRDRLRAASDELRAELAEIGTGVDAIRVELRSDLGEGTAHEGPGAERGRSGDGGPADTGRGEPDAAAWIGVVDPGQDMGDRPDGRDADGSASEASEGELATDRPDDDGRGRQPARDGNAESQQLRLLLAPQIRQRPVGGAQPGHASASDTVRRIDRYA